MPYSHKIGFVGKQRVQRNRHSLVDIFISIAIITITLLNFLVVYFTYSKDSGRSQSVKNFHNQYPLKLISAGYTSKPTLRARNDPTVMMQAPSFSNSGTISNIDPSDSTCWDHFDFGMVDAWTHSITDLCSPVQGRNSGWLQCHVRVDLLFPPPQATHTICEGANIILNLQKLAFFDCLSAHPSFPCEQSAKKPAYNMGAFSSNCVRSAAFTDNRSYEEDIHDMLASFRSTAELNESSFNATPSKPAVDLAPIVLLLNRDPAKRADAFRAHAQFLNMFIALHVAGVIDGAAGNRQDLEDVQVLLLEEEEGPFDAAFMRPVFSPNHPLLRASLLRAAGTPRVRLPRVLFVPPGRLSVMLADPDRLDGPRAADGPRGYCTARGGSRLLRRYRSFVLDGLGVPPQSRSPAAVRDAVRNARRVQREYALDAQGSVWIPDSDSGPGRGPAPWRRGFRDAPPAAPLRITLVSRRPHACDPAGREAVERHVRNEEEALARLQEALPLANVSRLDPACMPPRERVAAMAATDVLVAVHGAALTYALFLPDGAAVVEITAAGGAGGAFRHLSRMRGLSYRSLAGASDRNGTGEDVVVDAPALARASACAAAEVMAARSVDSQARGPCPEDSRQTAQTGPFSAARQ